jgi:hypothetical protein
MLDYDVSDIVDYQFELLDQFNSADDLLGFTQIGLMWDALHELYECGDVPFLALGDGIVTLAEYQQMIQFFDGMF